MATNKASSSSKKASAKKPAAKARTTTKPAVTAASTTGGSVSDNFAALRPGALIAEFLGTFVLAAAIIQLRLSGETTGFLVALAIMFVLIALVITFGVASGAHFNPAITIASWINRKTNGVKATAYIVMQVLGALVAFVVLSCLFNSSLDGRVKASLEQQGLTDTSAAQYGAKDVNDFIEQQGGTKKVAELLKIEFVKTEVKKDQEWSTLYAELLGSVIFGLGVGYAIFTSRKWLSKALAIGGGLFLGLIVGGGVAILNPAVASAVDTFHGSDSFMVVFWPILIYILTTVVGMTVGLTTYRLIARDTEAYSDDCC